MLLSAYLINAMSPDFFLSEPDIHLALQCGHLSFFSLQYGQKTRCRSLPVHIYNQSKVIAALNLAVFIRPYFRTTVQAGNTLCVVHKQQLVTRSLYYFGQNA